MAQTKRKRRTKHRGNAAGMRRVARAHGPQAHRRRAQAGGQGQDARRARAATASTGRRRGAARPTARSIAVVIFVAVLVLLFKQDPRSPRSRSALVLLVALHPAELLHRPVALPPPPGQAAAPKKGSPELSGRADVHRRPGAGEQLPAARRRGRRPRGDRRSGRGGRQPAGGARRARRHARRDPAHAHALRPRRRRRAGRARHRRPGLLPGARDARPRRHHEPTCRGRASARTSAGTPSRPSRAASSCSSPGFDIDVHLHARPQPRPRDLRDRPRRRAPGRAGRPGVRRRALPGLDRPHRPARAATTRR